MLTCISWSKQVAEGDDYEEGARGAAALRIKEAAKSFATQIKEMAQKLKPCPGSGRPFPKLCQDNSSLTPASDFVCFMDPSSQATFNRRPPVTTEDMLENGPKEWIAQVEPGVHITFAALLDGGNDLTRIRFSRELFDKWQAQRWWGENYDKILELYNVRRFNRQALQTPLRSEDAVALHPYCNKHFYDSSTHLTIHDSAFQRHSSYSRLGSARDSPTMTPGETYRTCGGKGYAASTYTSQTMTSSKDEVSVCVRSEVDSEWVEEDKPGVYITIRQMVDGTRELRRIRFSRERFAEVDAKQWWEENRDRIQAQYL